MKHILKLIKLTIFGVVLVVFLDACTENSTYSKLYFESERLLNDYPDSVLFLLEKINHKEDLSEEDSAYRNLMWILAKFKCREDISGDSVDLKQAVHYFSKKKLNKEAGTSFYLLGCLHLFAGNTPYAVYNLKEAENYLKSTNDLEIKGLVQFYLAYACMQQELYNHSLNYYRKSLEFFQSSGNLTYQAYAYREISNMFDLMQFPQDSVLLMLEKAIHLSTEKNDSVNLMNCYLRKGVLLKETNPMAAKDFLLAGINYSPEMKTNYAPYLAYIYSNLKMNDSAAYYLHVSMNDTTNTAYKIIGLNAASLISKNRQDYKDAYHFLEKSYHFRDSVFRKNIKSQLYIIDKQYDIAQKEKENTALTISNKTRVIWITLLIVLVLTISVLFLIYRNMTERKQRKLEIENQKKQFLAETLQNENEKKKEFLKLKLNSIINNTLKFNELNKKFIEVDTKDEFSKILIQKSILKEDEWPHFIEEFNLLTDNRLNELIQQFPDLTKVDIIVICLMCLDPDINKACTLLDMTKNTMYTRRKTIKKRLSLDENTDLEGWLLRKLFQGDNLSIFQLPSD